MRMKTLISNGEIFILKSTKTRKRDAIRKANKYQRLGFKIRIKYIPNEFLIYRSLRTKKSKK